MTVKLIGVQPVYQVICRNCGAVHEYEPTDTKEGSSDGDAYRYIKCLHCEAVIRVKPHN